MNFDYFLKKHLKKLKCISLEFYFHVELNSIPQHNRIEFPNTLKLNSPAHLN